VSPANRLVRRQLAVFAVVSLVAVLVVSGQYLQLPRILGWGRLHVTAHLPATGGLSASGLVTYRGVQIGSVTGVHLVPDGVVADLSIDRDAHVPAGVTARVHSTSAIGEQYVDLIPPRGGGTGRLADGSSVAAAAVAPVPVDAATLLVSIDRLARSVDPATLRTTVDELDLAFGGPGGPALAGLVDDGSALVTALDGAAGSTTSLLVNLGPVLRTQSATAGQWVSTATNLEAFTTVLATSDADLRQVIASGPDAARQVLALATDLHAPLPTLLANLGATGQVLTVYDAGTRQILTVYPALVAAAPTVGNASPPGPGGSAPQNANLFFHLNIDDPKGCRAGFPTPHRDPADTTDRTTPADGWCTTPGPAAVRGAQNYPCPDGVHRAPSAAGCSLHFTEKPTVTLTTYDPQTGAFVRNGKPWTITTTGGPLLAALVAGR
jgi:phospholipid/cholesterol/gamma-HCH transport system substrate-binding protein